MSADQVSESAIRALAQGIKDSQESVNNLVDLLEHLQSPASPAEVLVWTCEAISTAYEYLVSRNYTWMVHAPDWRKLPQSQPIKDVVAKYRDWMRKNYVSCKDQLLTLLAHESHDVQEAALDALLLLVKAEGTIHVHTQHNYTFPNSLLHQVTGHFLDNQTNTSFLIGHFKNYLVYDDVRFHWMKNVASIISFKKKQQITGQLVENTFSALRPLHAFMLSEDSQLNHEFFAGDPSKVEGGEDREVEGEGEGEGVVEEEGTSPPKAKKSRSQVRALDVQTPQKHRKQFSNAWLAFLRLPLSSSIHKKVLVLLHSEVMPHLVEPRLLLDFLVDSYDTGGVVSLLALNGLFILMHRYHLDYPDFYTRLYGLLEPSLFHVKYMPRFFSLMDTFLSSTHLPLYMVAAFAKRVARLSLSAPPQGVMVAVVFVINLLKRHPNCRVLLHRRNDEDMFLECDPFLMDERDLGQCHALESCLWEIKTLQSHYCPDVSLLVTQLLNSVNKKTEENIGKYLDRDDEDILLSAATKLSDGQDVPLNFQTPTAMWDVN